MSSKSCPIRQELGCVLFAPLRVSVLFFPLDAFKGFLSVICFFVISLRIYSD